MLQRRLVWRGILLTLVPFPFWGTTELWEKGICSCYGYCRLCKTFSSTHSLFVSAAAPMARWKRPQKTGMHSGQKYLLKGPFPSETLNAWPFQWRMAAQHQGWHGRENQSDQQRLEEQILSKVQQKSLWRSKFSNASRAWNKVPRTPSRHLAASSCTCLLQLSKLKKDHLGTRKKDHLGTRTQSGSLRHPQKRSDTREGVGWAGTREGVGWAGTREGWVGWAGTREGWVGWAGTKEGWDGWAGTRRGWEGGCYKAPQDKGWVAWMTAAARDRVGDGGWAATREGWEGRGGGWLGAATRGLPLQGHSYFFAK